MEIYRYIGASQYNNLIFVLYPTLLRHRMVPEMSEDTFTRLFSRRTTPLFREGCQSAISRMPMELWYQIAEHAEYGGPANSVALYWALGLRFWRVYGQPPDAVMQQLRVWSRRKGNKK